MSAATASAVEQYGHEAFERNLLSIFERYLSD